MLHSLQSHTSGGNSIYLNWNAVQEIGHTRPYVRLTNY